MPKKQKWGVISVFLLGVLVVISSSKLYHQLNKQCTVPCLTSVAVIRAIYSHLNEQMITCTVSMIEASIAIIASCLPVLRTLVFGSHSRTGTYSGRRGYELSNSGYNTTGGPTSKQRTTVSVTQTANTPDDLSRHDSEDGLVKDHGALPLSLENGAGIAVTREYFVHEGESDGRSFR